MAKLEQMMIEFRATQAQCASWAREIAEALGQPKPGLGKFCFKVDLGMAEVDGKQQPVEASICVAIDSMSPEVWIMVSDAPVSCEALGQSNGQPVLFDSTEEVVAFIKSVKKAMQQPLTTVV